MKFDFGKIANKVLTIAKEKAPEICLGVGIGTLLFGTVSACKKTYSDAHKIAEVNEADIDEVKNNDELEQTEKSVELVKASFRSVGRFAKLYSGPIIETMMGWYAIGIGFGILKNRYMNALLIGSSLAASMISYRSRVAEKIGAEEEEKLYLGIKEEVITEKITDENGKTKTVKKTVITDINPVSKYYIRIDDSWMLWNPNPEVVQNKLLICLNCVQSLFERQGWLSYNQFCESFGVPEYICPEGQLLGWAYVEGVDNVIKFIGMENQLIRFLNHEQNFLILNPNFDGDMHTHIPTGQKKFLEEIIN